MGYGFVVVAWLLMPGGERIMPFASMEACEAARESVATASFLPIKLSERAVFCVETGATRPTIGDMGPPKR